MQHSIGGYRCGDIEFEPHNARSRFDAPGITRSGIDLGGPSLEQLLHDSLGQATIGAGNKCHATFDLHFHSPM